MMMMMMMIRHDGREGVVDELAAISSHPREDKAALGRRFVNECKVNLREREKETDRRVVVMDRESCDRETENDTLLVTICGTVAGG
jgi:hypothetical protein